MLGQASAAGRKGIKLEAASARLDALDRVMAVIEFSPDGRIIDANENFCSTMGYAPSDIAGKHHSMFVDPPSAGTPEYARLWTRLRNGEFIADEFRRIAKGGREVWLQASYNPVFDSSKRVVRVIKFATDITAAHEQAIDNEGQIAAIHRSNAVIAFGLDGTIHTANENFLKATGYSAGEVIGKQHRMFMPDSEANSPAYVEFWSRMRSGEHFGGTFRRRRKDGQDLWIQATYNPIRDRQGRLRKVVKYATDVTDMVRRSNALGTTVDTSIAGIVSNVDSVARKASEISAASDHTTHRIQSAAAAAEQLDASIREISANTQSSQRSVTEAQTLAQTVDKATSELNENARQMSGIIDLIDSIASQINLLALNATIESARAGEAGRGFAVVASEVKQLASQVSTATRTISTGVESVQKVANEAARGLTAIQEAVGRISQSVSSVALSVEQQAGATSEISRTMQEAASSVTGINQDVAGIAGAVQNAASMTRAVGEDIKKLAS